jgi:hypothetical protein
MKVSSIVSIFLAVAISRFSDGAEEESAKDFFESPHEILVPFKSLIGSSQAECEYDERAIGAFSEKCPPALSDLPLDLPLDLPWFTGPLLTPTSKTIPAGYIDVEPYLFTTVQNGKYEQNWHAHTTPNFYTVNSYNLIRLGIAHWMNLDLIPQGSYRRTQGASSFVWNDLHANISLQLYKGDIDQAPNLRFYVRETFPTGRYQQLQLSKLHTDVGGAGCFVTGIGFVIGEKHHLYCESYLSWRFNLFYNFPASRSIHGLNTYGGASNTRGKIHLGSAWGSRLGLEYSLTRHWVLAFDAYGAYQNKIKFSGNPGTLANGIKASMGGPSSVQFSLAPAIEYSWSKTFGIIAGTWFTIGGRNSNRFISGVIAFNYYGRLYKNPLGNKDCLQ